MAEVLAEFRGRDKSFAPRFLQAHRPAKLHSRLAICGRQSRTFDCRGRS
jgi:hypothetical protein